MLTIRYPRDSTALVSAKRTARSPALASASRESLLWSLSVLR
ncbi:MULTISPECIES: hypothetical protein [Streptomyces]|uniref:Uncharacterized protein n=2 Tax=Streptomyces TaxID=1883 RepID=A0ABV9J3C0_9ACTN